MRLSIVIIALVLAVASGCGSKTADQKQQAQERWNNTRATILMGVALDQYKAQDFDKCRETLTKAFRMAPDSPQLHTLAAKVEISSARPIRSRTTSAA